MKYFRLLFFVFVSFLPSLSGVLVKPGEWYNNLIKPPLNPPNWVFGPVWTILYFLIGLAGWLAWENRTGRYRVAFLFFFVQLILNALWTILFFGIHCPLAAFIDLIILWILVVLNIVSFKKINHFSSILLFPYLAWISFAGYLNFALWQINR